MFFREKKCCQWVDKQHLAAVKNKGSQFQHCSGLQILELMSFADVFFPTQPCLSCIPFKACCPTTSLLQNHFSFQQCLCRHQLLRIKEGPTLTNTTLQLINESTLVNTRLHILTRVPSPSYHHTNNFCNFTLTCSFSCLMDCWRVRIWLNKGLLRVFLRTARFSWCWESLFSCSFACSRSRICSTCCLSAPQTTPG